MLQLDAGILGKQRGDGLYALAARLFFGGLFLLCACSSMSDPGRAQATEMPRGTGPAGKAFARMLAQVEAERAKHPEPNRVSNFNLLKVKEEDWRGTEEARFAHSIKIPNPVPVDSGYRRGMTQQKYFEHLCKTEAGEFIFKTADNVEGIFQMRPRRFMYETAEWQHLYAVEDPYGYWPGENDNPGREFIGPLLYSYLEAPPTVYQKQWAWQRNLDKSLSIPPPSDAKIARFFGYDNQSSRSTKLEYYDAPKARYGFTWRGIKRLNDREMGIAGGELIVLDLRSNEVMGVRRGYTVWNRGWGQVCPTYAGGQGKWTYFTLWFVAKVARPPSYRAFFERGWGRVLTDSNAKVSR